MPTPRLRPPSLERRENIQYTKPKHRFLFVDHRKHNYTMILSIGKGAPLGRVSTDIAWQLWVIWMSTPDVVCDVGCLICSLSAQSVLYPAGRPTEHHLDASRHCPAVWAQAISREPTNILSLHISYFALEQKTTQSQPLLGQFTPFRLQYTPAWRGLAGSESNPGETWRLVAHERYHRSLSSNFNRLTTGKDNLA